MRIETKEYHEQHCKKWRESGLTKKAYAEKIGIHPSTFYAWFSPFPKELKKPHKNTDQFVQVSVVPKSAKSTQREPVVADETGIVVITPQGYRLGISTSSDRQLLKDILLSLQAVV